MKNTKGKWTWIADEHSVPSIYKSDDLTFRIAKLWGNTPKDRQIADLIASAPEMLEALKYINKECVKMNRGDYDETPEKIDYVFSGIWKKAEEAIAKAEGK